MTIQQQISAGSVTPAVAKAIFQLEMKAALTAIIEVDAGLMAISYDSGLPSGDRGRIVIQQYWSGALQGGLRDAPGWTYADENWPKLTTEEKQHLMFAARRTPVRQELTQRAIALLLDAGVAVTPRNEAVAARVIIEARAKVAADALDPQWLEKWMEQGEDPPAVHALMTIDKSGPSIANAILQLGAEPCPPAALQRLKGTEEQRRYMSMTPVELAKVFIEQTSAKFDHRLGTKRQSSVRGLHTRRQIRWAADLLERVIPEGLPFSEVTPAMVKDLDDQLGQISRNFGKSERERASGIRLREAAAAAVEQVAEGKLAPDDVGLTIATCNKHYRWLIQVRDHLESKCPGMIARIDFGEYISPDDRDDRDARDEYTQEQGRAIFSLTPWIGCSGVEDRFAGGNFVIHDALFYVLLLCWYTGARREEICKLNLDDFKELDGIHYIEIRTTLTGRIKNASSKRPLPLCTELIRLGIVEYIGAMRMAGERLAFPEIMPGKPGRTLGDVFYKIWWGHIRPLVPDLKRGQAMHSCRHSVSTELADQDASEKTTDDLLGHKGKGERRARYAKRAKLVKLLALVDQIPVVTDHLRDVTRADIQLLPAQLRCPRPTRQKSYA